MGLLNTFVKGLSSAAPFISAAGTVISFLGAGKEAEDTSEALALKRRAYLNNAENIRLKSESERFKVGLQTTEDIADLKRQSFKQIGAVHAAVGASGVTSSGSVLDVIEESAYLANLDVQRRELAGKFQIDSINRDEAILVAEEEQKALQAGVAIDSVNDSKFFNQASTIIQGAGDIAGLS